MERHEQTTEPAQEFPWMLRSLFQRSAYGVLMRSSSRALQTNSANKYATTEGATVVMASGTEYPIPGTAECDSSCAACMDEVFCPRPLRLHPSVVRGSCAVRDGQPTTR